MDQLEFLDISDNKIQGELPRNIGVVFPNLILLDVSNNKFGGHIPQSIGEMENLTTLYLEITDFLETYMSTFLMDACHCLV
ncbi:Leucine-rich repeat receptor protein kinase [Arachis hypogaea]|nr:Leucine-rich repeat receptor protein kinase [Arachis hypogaea]